MDASGFVHHKIHFVHVADQPEAVHHAADMDVGRDVQSGVVCVLLFEYAVKEVGCHGGDFYAASFEAEESVYDFCTADFALPDKPCVAGVVVCNSLSGLMEYLRHLVVVAVKGIGVEVFCEFVQREFVECLE